MNQYKFYIFPMTLIILFGFLGVLELLNQTTTANAANVKTSEFIVGETEELTITSTDSSIAVGEITSLRVSFKDETGEPISKTEISFTPTPGITITPNLGSTNSDGILTATLTAGTFTGMISVMAMANISAQTLSDTVTITVTAGVPDKIMIINPPSMIRTHSTTILTTTLQDTYGNFVSDEEVSFAVIPFGKINSNTTNSVNGVSTATLTTSSMRGTINVTASIADHPSISDTKEMLVNPYQIFLSLIRKPLIPVITLIPSSMEIPADETVTITATVQNKNDNNFLSGQEVSFNTSSGNITPITSTTDMSGTVTAILNLKSNFKGTVTVTATVTDTVKEIDITVHPYPINLPFTDDKWSYDGNEPRITFQNQSTLLLGNNNPDECINGLPFPGKWQITSKEIPVPVGASKATINVKFEGFTFDRNRPLNEEFDFFKITVLGDKSQEPLVQELFANQTEEPGCNIDPPHSIGGPLNQYFLITNNNLLTIDIQVANQLDRYYNTWAEISEVSIDWE